MSDREPGFEKPFPETPEPAVPASPPPGASPPPPSAPAPAYAPLSPLPDPTPRVGYAGFWIRFLAWLIDAVLLWILNIGTHSIIRLSAGVSVFPLWSRSAGAPLGLTCAESLVEFAVNWLYFALFESSVSQATLGKQALRLRVTDLRGQRISFARATGRFFAKIVSFVTLCIGFVMIAFTSRRQGLHDMMAETVVLRDYR